MGQSARNSIVTLLLTASLWARGFRSEGWTSMQPSAVVGAKGSAIGPLGIVWPGPMKGLYSCGIRAIALSHRSGHQLVSSRMSALSKVPSIFMPGQSTGRQIMSSACGEQPLPGGTFIGRVLNPEVTTVKCEVPRGCIADDGSAVGGITCRSM